MKAQSDKKIPHIYFENLDALRFLAALSVFIFHFSRDINAYYPSLKLSQIGKALISIGEKGNLGVNFFFVLSGFLITYLILAELKNTGGFSLRKFLIRRTLRIWPLYFIVILIGFVLFPLFLEGYHTSHNPWMYVAFLANFDELTNGVSDSANFLTSPWSVAVEEQFYLFWGLLFFGLSRLKKINLNYIIFALYILSFIFRFSYWTDERIIYYHTFSVCQDIITGSFIAWSLHHAKPWIEKLKNIKKSVVILIYVLGIGICLAKNKIFMNELIVFERFVLSAFFGFVILDQIRGQNSFFKFGKIKPFNFLGKISYGIYMYHLIVMFLVVEWMNSWETHGYWMAVFYLLFSLIITIIIAVLSYFLIEKPLLKKKPI